MKKTSLKLFIVSVITISLSKSALSYIDPGTGGVIAGSLWPFIIAFLSAIGAFLLKHFWNPIKRFFSKLFKPKKAK